MAWHPTWNDDSEGRGGGRYRYIRWQPGRGGNRGLWTLILINVVVFAIFQRGSAGELVDHYGSLTPTALFFHGQVWRLVTSQFLHASFEHIFWNMFVFWMFGRIIERQMGTRQFVQMYLLAGVAGGLAQCGFDALLNAMGNMPPPIIVDGQLIQRTWLDVGQVGASAGVMGVVIAYALLNPNAMIYLFFMIPIRAKWLAIGYFVLESWPLVAQLTGRGVASHGGPMIAHAAHVGGMLYAFAWAAVMGYVNHPLAWKAKGMFDRTRGRLDRMRRDMQTRQARTAPRRDHPVVRGPNTPPWQSGPSARDEARLDVILKKIHDEGLGALTESERKFLREMSERKRDATDFDNRYRRE